MARLTPEQVASKWKNNTSASTQAMTDGVNAVTVAPGQQAARNRDLYLSRVQQNADKWARNTAAVPLQDWQQAMISRGIPRVAQGVSDAESKYASFMGRFLPHVHGVAERVRAMPKGNLEQGIARAAAQIRGNAEFKNQR